MSSVVAHNWSTLMELEQGDMVSFDRGFYSHWAVYEGEGRVIHMAGIGDDRVNHRVNSGQSFSISGVQYDKAEVKRDSFWDVAGEDKAYKDNEKDKKRTPLRPWEILQRARKMIGRMKYSVLCNNCEHFASYCRYGEGWSDQAALLSTLGTGLLIGGAVFVSWLMSGERKKEKQ